MSIYAALHLANRAHAGQTREDGSPYIDHPLAVLRLLWQCSIDLPAEAYSAALLHDVLEDTQMTYEDLLASVGSEIAAVVRMLTKDETYYALPKNMREHVYLRRLKEASSSYPYIVLIKIADRLHNIQTSDALSPERRQRLLIETQEIYLPFFESCLRKNPEELRGPFYKGFSRLTHSLFLTPALSMDQMAVS